MDQVTTGPGPDAEDAVPAWATVLAAVIGGVITLVLRTHTSALATLFTASTIMLISLTAGTQPQQLLSLPGELVNHLSWSPDGSRLIFDRTQVGFAGLTNPLGVWITSSDGSRLLAPFLGPATFAPAWGGATGR